MKQTSKAYAQRVHASRRAYERYGVALEPATFQRWVREIQEGKARFLRRQSNRVSLWMVDLAGRPAVVVYDRHRKSVVTVIDPEAPRCG